LFRGQFANNTFLKGELTLPDGTRFDGHWKQDNKFSGAGTIAYPNGDFYQGEWSTFLPHRKGRMDYKIGKTYTGEFFNGKKHGTGTLEYANGDVY